ncbi:unnamed protein product (macronuclear) [Paramecium tetraurelia]|uniref:Alpha/beta hydrolase fold-3 domain-containing protein n=1 Tax=Paramecium tetraurelia TaxID=5888 RepID=A0BWJ9_PARTE|nr:uncharacterized protein GSPATT00032768001 [Paramecium tetraurelia]CAK62916.1 unnamed protein product [Paramecium tetraurelia]|eukprot:XP_001430314.1 hypothetical protein (macronuclear) [Paramecium tetraurelia strain d4-2]
MQSIEDQIKSCMSMGNLTQDITLELRTEEQSESAEQQIQMQQEWNQDQGEFKQNQQQLQQQDINQIQEQVWNCPIFNSAAITKELYQNLSETYDLLNKLHLKAIDLTKKFNAVANFLPRFFQAIKITFIGILQLEQIGLITNDKDIMSKSINEEYNINVNKKKFNEKSVCILLEFAITHILSQILVLFETIEVRREKQELRQLVIYLSKLQTCLEQLPGAANLDINDIFCFDRGHYRWQSLNSITQEVLLGSREQISKSYGKVAEGILLANAMISKGSEFSNEAAKNVMQGFGALYYLVAKKDAKLKADHFMAEPNKNLAFKAWNLGESGFLSKLLPLLFPMITYNKKIYIPQLFKRLVEDNILRQYKENNINHIQNDCGECVNTNLPKSPELFTKNKERIPVRILCHYNLQEIQTDSFVQHSLKLIQGQKVFDRIIIHIHGGGFVSMSSRSHQTYTRKWAKNLQVPIFSIDYRKAPESPYPFGLDDCWQAYMFIMNYIDKYFNVKPKKVVLVGDSAGGNLVAALTVQIIKSGARIPDGILMAYPALCLDIKQFTPSLLISLNDPLLHHTVLKLCISSYVPQQFDAASDPLMSPSIASDEILSRFPKTRIVLGTNDPLHDESFRLANKLLKLGKDIKITEYKWMPHGFLQFDVVQGMKESEQTVLDAQNILQDLLTC